MMFGRQRAPRLDGEQRSSKASTTIAGSSSKAKPSNSTRKIKEHQALVTSERLLQWQKKVNAKRDVQAKLQQDKRDAEERELLARQHRALPRRRIEEASTRNYLAAHEIQWKRVVQRTRIDHKRLQEEERDCTFHPQRIAKSPTTGEIPARYLLPITRPAERPMSPSLRRKKVNAKVAAAVIARLYDTRKTPKPASPRAPSSPRNKATASSFADFLCRQELDELDRLKNRLKLCNKYSCSFKPHLSKGTRELCKTLKRRSMEEILREQRDKRDRKLEKCIGKRLPRPPSPSRQAPPVSPTSQHRLTEKMAATETPPVSISFEDLLKQLRLQEQQMGAMTA